MISLARISAVCFENFRTSQRSTAAPGPKALHSQGNMPGVSHGHPCYVPMSYLTRYSNKEARTQAGSQPFSYRLGEWRRKSIPDLAVHLRLCPGELPFILKTLQAGNHANCKPWHACKIRAGSFVRYAKPIHAERGPGFPCPCRTEIGAAMLMGAADNSGGNFISLFSP